MNRKFIYSILFLICFTALERFCHKQTHGFRPYKVYSTGPKNPLWKTSLPADFTPKQIQSILSQPFYFLNSGGESYAFVSKDGEYVLKFFKHHHMRPVHWSDPLLPFPLKVKLKKNREEKLSTLFTSCKLAYENFREGTGLIYLHLYETDFLKKKLKLFDAIGAVHSFNLDKLDFALQRKATMAYPTLDALVEAKEYKAAKERLASLVNLIVTRCKAGLEDHDARKRNFGFVGGNAIEIDLGSFTQNENLRLEDATRKVLILETLRLRRWVKKYHPVLYDFLEETIKETLNNCSGGNSK